MVYYKAIENLLSADGATVWLPEFDIAGCTNQVTAGQQQCTLPTLEWVCTDRALAEAFIEGLLHSPKLFLQVLTDRMVATFNQQLHLPRTSRHAAFTSTLDILLSALSVYLNDVQAGRLGVV